MSTTNNLRLNLTDRAEWPSKKFSQFLLELAGVSDDSNMQILDRAIGHLNYVEEELNTFFETI